jgi:hypothetical protein
MWPLVVCESASTGRCRIGLLVSVAASASTWQQPGHVERDVSIIRCRRMRTTYSRMCGHQRASFSGLDGLMTEWLWLDPVSLVAANTHTGWQLLRRSDGLMDISLPGNPTVIESDESYRREGIILMHFVHVAGAYALRLFLMCCQATGPYRGMTTLSVWATHEWQCRTYV